MEGRGEPGEHQKVAHVQGREVHAPNVDSAPPVPLECYALSVVNFALSVRPEDVRRHLGAVLRAHREGQGRRLSDIAAEAGCSPAYLSEVERGVKDVSSDRLVAIAYALSVSPARVFAQLAEALEGPDEPAWPADPRQRLNAATSVLDAQSLAAVASFSTFLASGGTEPRRRIGFQPPSAR